MVLHEDLSEIADGAASITVSTPADELRREKLRVFYAFWALEDYLHDADFRAATMKALLGLTRDFEFAAVTMLYAGSEPHVFDALSDESPLWRCTVDCIAATIGAEDLVIAGAAWPNRLTLAVLWRVTKNGLVHSILSIPANHKKYTEAVDLTE